MGIQKLHTLFIVLLISGISSILSIISLSVLVGLCYFVYSPEILSSPPQWKAPLCALTKIIIWSLAWGIIGGITGFVEALLRKLPHKFSIFVKISALTSFVSFVLTLLVLFMLSDLELKQSIIELFSLR